jgi:hypothetical protein
MNAARKPYFSSSLCHGCHKETFLSPYSSIITPCKPFLLLLSVMIIAMKLFSQSISHTKIEAIVRTISGLPYMLIFLIIIGGLSY